MLPVPDHPLRLNVFLYISQSPLTSVRSAVQLKLLPWLFVLQEDRNGLPGCMERIQLLLGVSSQKPKRNWLMIGLSRESKKTGNDRQLFFHLVVTSSVASLQSAKTAISFSAPYILYICICKTPCIYVWEYIAKTHSQSLEKDFS